jgi:hypothetical protein
MQHPRCAMRGRRFRDPLGRLGMQRAKILSPALRQHAARLMTASAPFIAASTATSSLTFVFSSWICRPAPSA